MATTPRSEYLATHRSRVYKFFARPARRLDSASWKDPLSGATSSHQQTCLNGNDILGSSPNSAASSWNKRSRPRRVGGSGFAGSNLCRNGREIAERLFTAAVRSNSGLNGKVCVDDSACRTSLLHEETQWCTSFAEGSNLNRAHRAPEADSTTINRPQVSSKSASEGGILITPNGDPVKEYTDQRTESFHTFNRSSFFQ